MLALNTLAIGAASFFAVVAANHGQISRTHHHNPLLERSEAHLQKRFAGTATYYITGLGACGITNGPDDYIVALNSAQYGGGYPGPHCFKKLNMCANGKCRTAQVTDECPTCNYGSLDLSRGLFEQFAPTSDGVFQMTWTWADDDSEPEPTKQPDPPKTSKKPDPPKTTKEPEPPKTTKEPEPEPEPTTSSKKPKPSTTSTQPETTSTPEPTTTSSTSTSSVPETTSTSTVVSIMTTSTVSAPASPSGAPGSGSGSGASGSNWADMAQVFLAMGRMATTAHSQ